MSKLNTLAIIFFLLFIAIKLSSQESLKYLLSQNFEEEGGQHVDLLQLANEDGDTGSFGVFNVPTSTCPTSFDVDGYDFEDNAGLRFDNNGFISCEYTVQFTFHIKDFTGPQGWVRLINFTPDDDNGIYIRLTGLPTTGSLEFWPNGLVGTDDFFNAIDLYQFIITRECSGLVKIYVNGEFFADYDDSGSPLYLVQPTEDLIDFFQDDTSVPNEASPGWVKNIVISNFAFDLSKIEDDWSMFCEELQETDCAGVVNGTSVLDECGVCLEMSDPTFNQSCIDCNGTLNGGFVVDDCGVCIAQNDPNFNASCADCAGNPNGTAVIDDCGECLDPSDPTFNQSCIDCAGVMNGTSLLDECGECLEQNDPNFNQSCADCAGVPNGTAVLDECGECLDPNDPNFNQSCADCAGVPNGTAEIDECGECLEANDPLFNQTCLDCNGTINGTAVIDECNVCLEPDDPDYNKSCITEFYFPTAFSPNDDGFNDNFQVFKSDDTEAIILNYQIYNRWGEQIFSSRNIEFGDLSQYWDGTHNGTRVSEGSYLYFVEIQFPNGTIRKYSGDVAILK